MNIITEDYKVESNTPSKITLTGVLRLPTPTSYDEPFMPLKKSIESGNTVCEWDIEGVTYLNSSGINALARLVILARTKNINVNILAKDAIPWQKKSIKSLEKLWDKLSVKLS